MSAGTLAEETGSARPPPGVAARSRRPRIVPVIVIVNWIESVTSTPQSPETDAKKMVMTEQTSSVRSIGQPRTTFAILAAARFTVAMITQLKRRPR